MPAAVAPHAEVSLLRSALGLAVLLHPPERVVVVDVDVGPAAADLRLVHVLARLLDVAQEAAVAVPVVLGGIGDQLDLRPAVELSLQRGRGLGAAALLPAVDLGRIDPDQADVALRPALDLDLDRVAVGDGDDTGPVALRLRRVGVAPAASASATATGAGGRARAGVVLTGDAVAVAVQPVWVGRRVVRVEELLRLLLVREVRAVAIPSSSRLRFDPALRSDQCEYDESKPGPSQDETVSDNVPPLQTHSHESAWPSRVLAERAAARIRMPIQGSASSEQREETDGNTESPPRSARCGTAAS